MMILNDEENARNLFKRAINSFSNDNDKVNSFYIYNQWNSFERLFGTFETTETCSISIYFVLTLFRSYFINVLL
jgi:hypothetical protein